MTSLELLDSARHKLAIARWHGAELQRVLDDYVPDDLDDPRRLALEGHLEGIAYMGTAAAEKTIRSLAPLTLTDQGNLPTMIRLAKNLPEPGARDFATQFETWWMQRGRPTRYAQAARDLRNDAAHSAYEKTAEGVGWCMRIRNQREGIELTEFARGYLAELGELDVLVAEADELAAVE